MARDPGLHRHGVRSPARKSRLLAYALLAGLWLVVIPRLLADRTLQTSALAVVLTAVVSLWFVYHANDEDPWSAAFVLLLVIIVFHVGALSFAAFGLDPAFPTGMDASWYFSGWTVSAAGAVTLSLAAYAVGCVLFSVARAPSQARELEGGQSRRRRDALATAGLAALSLSVLAWFAIAVTTGGFALLGASYQSFLSTTDATYLFATYLLMASGVSLAALASTPKFFRWALIVFGAFALVALPLGLRGEVLFPLTAAALVRSRFVRLPSLTAMLVVGLVALSLASLFKEVRQEGLAEFSPSSVAVSPAAGLAELGSTVRVVSVVSAWHGPEPLANGRTYAAPFTRPFRSYVLGQPDIQARSDPDLLNVVIARREGNIGGSIIGEAMHNFGTWGGAAVLGLLGASATLLRRKLDLVRQAVLLALLAAPILNHVRNGFVAVPIGIGVTVSVVLAGLVLERLNSESV